MKLLKLILDGATTMGDVLIWPREHSYPAPGGFKKDQENLRRDVVKVGDDMKKAIKQYGREQPYKR